MNFFPLFLGVVLAAAGSPPAGDYDVKLRPPNLRIDDETHIPPIIGRLPSRGRTSATFKLPRFEDLFILMVGDSTVRYEFHSPSGRRFVPGETPNRDGFESGGPNGFQMLSMERPEPGTWTAIVDAGESRDSVTYFLDISSKGAVDEQPHLEAFSRDSHPNVSSFEPGTLVYVRAFMLKGNRFVPGVDWSVKALITRDSPKVNQDIRQIRVFDDGLHADESAGDGIFVGSIRLDGPDGVYGFVAEAGTQEGVRYMQTTHLEVQARYDVLIADEVVVSPNSRVGKPVTLTVIVRNDGPRDYQGVNLNLGFAPGPNETTQWEEKESRKTFDLRAGELRRIALQWTPSNAGRFFVRLSVDPQANEIDYANNSRVTVVDVH